VHTRRVAAFLLGAWLGGSLLMILIQAGNLRFTNSLLSTQSDQAAAFVKKTGTKDFALMMRYQAVEQNRRYAEVWEDIQMSLGLLLAATLFLGTQRRIFPMVFCGLMVLMVGFEHFGVTPALAVSGRETDFPPGNAAVDSLVRMYALGQVYAWVEGFKLVLGVLLSGYLFIFRARRTRRSSDVMEPSPSHIGR
jgi:hypothetical protein